MPPQLSTLRYRRVKSLVVAATVVLLPLPVMNADRAAAQNAGRLKPENAKEKLKKFQSDLESAQNKEKGLSEDIQLLSKERERLNSLLITTAKRIQDGEGKLSKIENRLGELAEQEKLIRGSIAQRHSTLAKILAVMQRMGRQPPPVMVTRRDDALKMVRSGMLLASVFPQLRNQAEKLSSELTDLVRIIANIQIQAESLRSENQKLANERLRIKALLAAKKSRILANQTSLKEIQHKAEEFKQNVENLTELIEKLDREVAQNAELGKYDAELAAKKASEPPEKPSKDRIELLPKSEKVAALISPGRLKPALPFSESEGRLPRPVQGKTIKRFANRNRFGVPAQGISVKTREYAQITSPSDGWVVYAGEFRSYKQLLIINVGEGYHVLLAGMGQIDVNVGQFVLAGEPVATMGIAEKPTSAQDTENDNDSESFPVLYVEFRKDGRPIDPDPWWSNESEKAQG